MAWNVTSEDWDQVLDGAEKRLYQGSKEEYFKICERNFTGCMGR